MGGVTLFDQQTEGGGWKALDADSGQRFKPLEWLTPLPLRCGPSGEGVAHREACSWLYICILCPWVVVLIIWQLGRLIVDKQQDYEGSLWEQREHWVGKACDLWGWEEISQGRLELPFNSVPKEMKALCKEDIEISRQKIVDILEKPKLLIFILLMWMHKEDEKHCEGKK